MSIVAIILIFISAIMHATWNLMGKAENPSLSFFLIANTFGTLFFLPYTIINFAEVSNFPFRVFALSILSGLYLGVYYFGLAGAYRSGDMSLAYPLVRSSPIIVVVIVIVLLGQGSEITGGLVVGIFLIVMGSLLIPVRHFNEIKLSNFKNYTCLFSITAGFGTAGYSILDDGALDLLRNTSQLSLNIPNISLIYLCLQGIFASLWMLLFAVTKAKERQNLLLVLKTRKRNAALTGGIIFATYALVLISMSFVENVSYVVAFRQFSIVIGAIFSVVFLKEVSSTPKIIGVLTMFIGLVLIGVS